MLSIYVTQKAESALLPAKVSKLHSPRFGCVGVFRTSRKVSQEPRPYLVCADPPSLGSFGSPNAVPGTLWISSFTPDLPLSFHQAFCSPVNGTWERVLETQTLSWGGGVVKRTGGPMGQTHGSDTFADRTSAKAPGGRCLPTLHHGHPPRPSSASRTHILILYC